MSVNNNVTIVILIIMTTMGAVFLTKSGNAVQAGALIALAGAVLPHLGGGTVKKKGKKDDVE